MRFDHRAFERASQRYLALKSEPLYRVEGYCILHTTPYDKDRYEEWFDGKSRVFRPQGLFPLRIHHGAQIGHVTRTWRDSQGLGFEGYIMEYAKSHVSLLISPCGVSSGAYLADIDDDDGHINEWHLEEISLTNTRDAAEPRLTAAIKPVAKFANHAALLTSTPARSGARKTAHDAAHAMREALTRAAIRKA